MKDVKPEDVKPEALANSQSENTDENASLEGNDGPQDRYELYFSQPDPCDFPRLCDDIEPIGGFVKAAPEDFQVEEIPLYEFCGEGEHLYVTIEKRNRTTLQVREQLARWLGIRTEQIGFAGLKDKRGITQQTISLQGVEEAQLAALELPDSIRILQVTRHKNKLRAGHLRGNKFKIVVRQVREGALAAAQKVAARLCEVGLPNFYGSQRFGVDRTGYKIGHALLHREPEQAIHHILGPFARVEEEFRQSYAEGKYERALEQLPPGRSMEAAILHTMIRYGGNHRAAARKINKQMRRIYFSAYQSFLFNWTLMERSRWGVESLHTPILGDLAVLHGRGAVFLVEDEAEAIERAAAGEIGPTGPIFGRKMSFPRGQQGALEWAVLRSEKLRPQSFLSHSKGLSLDGTRRPMTVPIDEIKIEELEPGVLQFEFQLPPGAYATTLLDQIMGLGQTEARMPYADRPPWEGSADEEEEQNE